jgi:N-acetylmuramoyl-L-alanine amidase
MKKTLQLLLLLLILELFPNPGFALPSGWEILPSANIYFSENPIDTEFPLLKHHNIIFAPLRPLLPHINATMDYQRKSKNYMVLIEGISTPILISPNNNQVIIGNKTDTFPDAPIMHMTRLYVPLEHFLRIAKYDISQNGTNISVVATPQSPIAPATTASVPHNPSSTNEKTGTLLLKIKSGTSVAFSTQIPNLSIIDHPQMKMENSNIDISNDFSYSYGSLHINILPLLETLNYSTSINGSTLTLKNGKTDYIFNSNSNKMTVSSAANKTEKVLAYTPIITENKAYFPLTHFAKDLGYIQKWDANSGTLELWPIIEGIELWKYPNNLYKLRIISKQLLPVKGQYMLSNPLRLFWDIPNAAMKLEQNNTAISDTLFTRFYAGQHEDKTRITFKINSRVNSINYPNINGVDIYISKHSLPIQTPPQVATPLPTPIPRTIPKPKKSLAANGVLKGMIIAIDPGHGGIDPGAVTKHGDLEKIYTLDISKRLETLLKQGGATVLMARTNDKNPSLYERTMLANVNKADILLSIHINSFIKSYANGIETYYYKRKDKPLANAIHL